MLVHEEFVVRLVLLLECLWVIGIPFHHLLVHFVKLDVALLRWIITDHRSLLVDLLAVL